MSHLAILFFALIADRFIGDPDWFWRRMKHPVVLFGALVSFCDERFNRPEKTDREREAAGFGSIAAIVILMIVVGALMQDINALLGLPGALFEIVIVTVFLAQKSLADHIKAVAKGLRAGGLEGGRQAVSMVVGRDPKTLDKPDVCRAAIESLAENASDGVVAPAFWYAVFGLPGLFAYKMLNTADSMIGHKNEKYRAFGRAAAQFDDLANWLPARLTGALIIVATSFLKGGDAAEHAWAVMRRDAGLHRSPNAGWPESAMAGALDIALGGPRVYAGDAVDEPFMNAEGYKDASPSDISAALKVFWRTMTLFTVCVLLAALLYG